jgi:hypothetical protein
MRTGVKAAYEKKEDVCGKIGRAAGTAMFGAVCAAREELIESGRLPYKTGGLSESTYVDGAGAKKNGEVLLISETGYAAGLYYHPEYKFSRRVNKNAGGGWFETFISGGGKALIEREFARKARELIGSGG